MRLDNDSMTIEDIAIALESDEITDEQAYFQFIEEEEQREEGITVSSLRADIEEMYDTSEISAETRDTVLGFLK